MFERFSRDARAVVVSARDLCLDLDADEIRPVHLLLALTEEGSGVRDLLAAHDVTTDSLARCLGVSPPARPAALDDDDAAALRSLGIDLDAIREAVERQFGEGALEEGIDDVTEDDGRDAPAADDDADWWARRRRRGGGHARFTRGSKKVLELSLREAIRTGAREIHAEHIALGVLRADDEAVSLLMRSLGVDVCAVRADLGVRGRRTA